MYSWLSIRVRFGRGGSTHPPVSSRETGGGLGRSSGPWSLETELVAGSPNASCKKPEQSPGPNQEPASTRWGHYTCMKKYLLA